MHKITAHVEYDKADEDYLYSLDERDHHVTPDTHAQPYGQEPFIIHNDKEE